MLSTDEDDVTTKSTMAHEMNMLLTKPTPLNLLSASTKEILLVSRASDIITTAASCHIPYAFLVPAFPTNVYSNTEWHNSLTNDNNTTTATFPAPPNRGHPQHNRLAIIHSTPQAHHFLKLRQRDIRAHDVPTTLTQAVSSFLNVNHNEASPTHDFLDMSLLSPYDGRDNPMQVNNLVSADDYAPPAAPARNTLMQYNHGFYRILLDQQSFIATSFRDLMPHGNELTAKPVPTPYSAMLNDHLMQARNGYQPNTLSSAKVTHYHRIIDLLGRVAHYSRPDLACIAILLYSAWDTPTEPLLQAAETALLYLWQTRALSLSCPATKILPRHSNGPPVFRTQLSRINVVLHNDTPRPAVHTFHTVARRFIIQGDNTTQPPPTASPTKRSKLRVQAHDFPGIDDFLGKPLDATLFHSYRDQAMGHKRNRPPHI